MYSRKLHQTPFVVFFLPCSTSLRSCRSFNSGNYELLDAAGNGTDCIVLYRQRVEEEQQHVVVFIDIIYGASCSSSKEFITLSAVCHHHQHFRGGGQNLCEDIHLGGTRYRFLLLCAIMSPREKQIHEKLVYLPTFILLYYAPLHSWLVNTFDLPHNEWQRLIKFSLVAV